MYKANKIGYKDVTRIFPTYEYMTFKTSGLCAKGDDKKDQDVL